MKTCLLTGSQGFIGSYIAQELLNHGYYVFGADNNQKYGKRHLPHNDHTNFQLIEADLSKDYHHERLWTFDDVETRIAQKLIKEGKKVDYNNGIPGPDYVIACAASIGGIQFFHKYAYNLISNNERILANTIDAAIKWQCKTVMLSSSMVYECAHNFPSKEEDVDTLPPPKSSYGFQKLMAEQWVKAANHQYKLPYTIVRPFNCVGIGEDEALVDKDSINHKVALSHVIPDLVGKVLRGEHPYQVLGDGEQVRCYTHGRDIARGIRLAMESDAANGEAFNISSNEAISVADLLHKIVRKIRGKVNYTVQSLDPFEHDVRYRLPDVSKAERLLGFKAEVSLDESLNEVINYMR